MYTSNLHRCVAKSLYIPNNIQILAYESVLASLHRKKQNPLSVYREGDTALHSIAPLCAQSSYDGEKLACSNMVVGLPNNEGRSVKVALGRKHGTVSDNTYFCPIIAVSEF